MSLYDLNDNEASNSSQFKKNFKFTFLNILIILLSLNFILYFSQILSHLLDNKYYSDVIFSICIILLLLAFAVTRIKLLILIALAIYSYELLALIRGFNFHTFEIQSYIYTAPTFLSITTLFKYISGKFFNVIYYEEVLLIFIDLTIPTIVLFLELLKKPLKSTQQQLS
jgi:hypothetical protein